MIWRKKNSIHRYLVNLGYFGKLPVSDEFIRSNLSNEFCRQLIHQFEQRYINENKSHTNRVLFTQSSDYHFLISSTQLVLGSLQSTVDSHGRPFFFCQFFDCDSVRFNPLYLPVLLEPWFQHNEAITKLSKIALIKKHQSIGAEILNDIFTASDRVGYSAIVSALNGNFLYHYAQSAVAMMEQLDGFFSTLYTNKNTSSLTMLPLMPPGNLAAMASFIISLLSNHLFFKQHQYAIFWGGDYQQRKVICSLFSDGGTVSDLSHRSTELKKLSQQITTQNNSLLKIIQSYERDC